MSMGALVWNRLATPLLAFQQGATLRAVEFDWPDSAWRWLLYGGGFALVFVLAVFVYLRDTRGMPWYLKAWMMLLRVGVLAALIVMICIALALPGL